MKNTFTEVAIVSIVVTAVTIGLLWVTGAISILSDDDRPPVVVSSGSVIIKSGFDPADEKRGKFDKVGADAKKWKLTHGKAVPNYFTVIIDDSTSVTPACQPTNIFTNLEIMTFSYSWDNAPDDMKAFTVSIQKQSTDNKNALQFDFSEDVTQDTDFLLSLGDNGNIKATLKSVTIGTDRCNLGPKSRVEIRQRRDHK